MTFFDFFALTMLTAVPILWCRSRLPQFDRDPPISDRTAVLIGCLVAALLSGYYIYRYVLYR